MKKITSLQILMLMSLALGSSYTMIAKSSSSEQRSAVVSEEKSVSMKSIEHRLNKIRQDFERSRNVTAANKALKQIEKDIKKCISQLKAKEVHGKMYEVHEHTLERKLKEVRDFVNKSTKKKAKKKASSK